MGFSGMTKTRASPESFLLLLLLLFLSFDCKNVIKALHWVNKQQSNPTYIKPFLVENSAQDQSGRICRDIAHSQDHKRSSLKQTYSE